MTALPARLRPAELADLDAIVALDRATELAPHWPVAAYAAILDATGCRMPNPSPSRCLFVAEGIQPDEAVQGAWLLGFAVGLVHPSLDLSTAEPRLAELEDVVVAAEFRRGGIGRALCLAALEWCHLQGATEVDLEVRAANVGAIALYAQLGFEEVGRRRRYYREPEDDAVGMRLRWGGSNR